MDSPWTSAIALPSSGGTAWDDDGLCRVPSTDVRCVLGQTPSAGDPFVIANGSHYC